MEHVTSLANHPGAVPVGMIGRTEFWQSKSKNKVADIPFKKTRSTIVLDARDVDALSGDQTAIAIGRLFHTCTILGRSEIVVEQLENQTLGADRHLVLDSFNAIQSAVVTASRKSRVGNTRIALEKHGEHHDVRIYLNLH